MKISAWMSKSNLKDKEAARLLFFVIQPKTSLDANSWVLSHLEFILSARHLSTLSHLNKRRLKGEPLEYITGQAKFLSLNLLVNPSVLIPRPETEELVNLVITEIKKKSSLHSTPYSLLADIGTGSGAIAISLALWAKENHFPLKIMATDISTDALKVAQYNSAQYSILNTPYSPQFLRGHLLDPIKEKLDYIVANLPYIPSHWLTKLEKCVKDYEPEIALDGGPDGYNLIDQLIKQAESKLKPEGKIFLEIWDEHNKEHFDQFDQFRTEIIKDSFNRTRFAVLQRKAIKARS